MSLMRNIKKLIKNLLYKQKIRVGKPVEKQPLLDFLRSIRPITTQFKLIRIGGTSDGGYLVPDDLDQIETCFSPGVSNVAEFERDLTERGITCYLADYSVDGPPLKHPMIDFEKKYIGNKNTDIYMTLDHWMTLKTSDPNDYILQMDIEGSEYEVIHDVSLDTLKKFRILLIEFHGLDYLVDEKGFELIRLTFEKLLKAFEIVHIHPNNCCEPAYYEEVEIPVVMEFTLLRKDRIKSRTATRSFPHPLDQKNVASKQDVRLPKLWYNDSESH